ncbi:three-Cys-motif partner protein TcmP [Rhizobium lentis]|uniref:Three-Cys-motif partner protein TcmP n=1 Tax=Rhizobium lentis TaxID=1138194 RepID=A0A9Q3M9P6_9HYPH|nr:three-Cys-motif partner protein TcmP [Rhizobium lentis]MBX5009623.1 three-Cys-motif partner protein TcmP [Rhizobium lentis]MBX5022029.1 three-Cys-motif partner protein TcmP [Rhizobium lentis]
MTTKFFEERGDQSAVKAEIVQKYFTAWANIVLPATQQYGGGKIAYIDLYAGPGRYKDGAASTPLLVLQKAIENPKISAALVALFNDMDQNNTQTLQAEINALPGIERLKNPPTINCNPVDKDAEEYFATTKIIPSFTFLDPFGYKGLSLRLVNGVIKDWGCDCVFFFNYNRISLGISNPLVQEHMAALFGNSRADELKARVEGSKPALREQMILEELSCALMEMGGKFVLPFRFRNDAGRLTHHLVFVSKSFKGYEVMKEIMASASSTADQGVASFAYSPADETMPLLFELARPLDDLEGMLKQEYAGKTASMRSIYEQHSVGRPYLSKHYKGVLAKMDDAGVVTVSDPEGKPRKRGTFADRLLVTFPEATI